MRAVIAFSRIWNASRSGEFTNTSIQTCKSCLQPMRIDFRFDGKSCAGWISGFMHSFEMIISTTLTSFG
jgi:hypothetical protein